jgi:hypothetical protein
VDDRGRDSIWSTLVGHSITRESLASVQQTRDCVHCVRFGFRLVASRKASVHFVDTNNERSDFTACGVITHIIHRTWLWCCVSRRGIAAATATTKASRASDCLLRRRRRRFMMS